MRDIIGYLRHHLRAHVHPGLHLLLGVLLAAAFVYNYSTDFKRTVMNAHPGTWVEILMYLAFYGVPFYGALLLQSRLTRVSVPRDGRFWLVSALALLLLALNRSALALSPRLLDDLDLVAELGPFRDHGVEHQVVHGGGVDHATGHHPDRVFVAVADRDDVYESFLYLLILQVVEVPMLLLSSMTHRHQQDREPELDRP